MKRLALAAQLAPVIIPFALFFIYSLVLTVGQSFGAGAVSDYQEDAFYSYSMVLNDPVFLRNALFSLWISFVSSFGSVVLGSLLAWQIRKLPDRLQTWSSVYRIPIILPHITVAFLILFLFSNRGLIPALAYQLVSADAAENLPEMIYSSMGWSIIIAYLYKEVPFVVLMQLSVLSQIPEERLITAQMLGAGPWRTYFKVVFPQLRAVINTVFIILFLYSLGAFDIPFILGMSKPSMLSVRVYRLYFESDLVNRPLVMARLTLMFLFSLGFIFIFKKSTANVEKRGEL
jgi:putative spermidine/putrescine transport system permease protein